MSSTSVSHSHSYQSPRHDTDDMTEGSGVYGPRLLRFVSVTDFSVHDIALVDSPAFHFVMDTVTNGEVYNMIVRGGNQGGLDGFNLMAAKNVHVHDVAVTNKDECVTVKNKSSNILVENVFCNWSGGCGIGSLGVDTGTFRSREDSLHDDATINKDCL